MKRVLLLDANYLALAIVPWKKAVRLMFNDKAEPVLGSSTVIGLKTVSGNYCVPAVIKLNVQIPWVAHSGQLKFSKKNVAIRDRYICQYCGIKVSKSTATIDHVIPRSRGGGTTYRNCVICCKKCNGEKADRPLTQTNMKIKREPKRPTFMDIYNYHMSNGSPQEWSNYMT